MKLHFSDGAAALWTNLTNMFLVSGETYADIGRTSTQRAPILELDPGPSCWEAAARTSLPTCRCLCGLKAEWLRLL